MSTTVSYLREFYNYQIIRFKSSKILKAIKKERRKGIKKEGKKKKKRKKYSFYNSRPQNIGPNMASSLKKLILLYMVV